MKDKTPLTESKVPSTAPPKLNIQSVKGLSLILGINESELRELAARAGQLFRKTKMQIGSKPRSIFLFHPRLKKIQKLIHARLLRNIKLPEIFHGGVRGKSIVSHASGHVNKEVVVNLDIRKFYPNVHHTTIYNGFISLGCSPDVAGILTKLVSADYQLPQGAATSSMVGNLALLGLERRLRILCEQHGFDLGFWIDDITISGNHRLRDFVKLIKKIVKQAGRRVNEQKFEKTGIMSWAGPQLVTGLLVNQKVDVPKDYIDQIKADMRKFQIHSPAGLFCSGEDLMRLREKLRGQIGHVKYINPQLGKRLLNEFKQIQWGE